MKPKPTRYMHRDGRLASERTCRIIDALRKMSPKRRAAIETMIHDEAAKAKEGGAS